MLPLLGGMWGEPGGYNVVEFKKSYANYGYYLLFREGPAGRIRFDRIRVEKI